MPTASALRVPRCAAIYTHKHCFGYLIWEGVQFTQGPSLSHTLTRKPHKTSVPKNTSAAHVQKVNKLVNLRCGGSPPGGGGRWDSEGELCLELFHVWRKLIQQCGWVVTGMIGCREHMHHD